MLPGFAQMLILIIAIFIAIILPAYLFASVIRKSGHNPWWTVLTLLPIVNVLAIWVFAFVAWPVEDQEPPRIGPAE